MSARVMLKTEKLLFWGITAPRSNKEVSNQKVA